MTHRIPDQVIVPIVWNNDENTWEIDADHLPKGPLEQSTNLDDRTCAHDDLHDRQICDEVWGRASASDLPSAEDLTHMLGFTMVRATAPANADVEWRPASPSLVGMLKDVMDEHLGATVAITARDRLIRALLPIISSVDENAHRRGMFDQRQAALSQGARR